MDSKMNVAVVVGSLREGSFTRQVANHLRTYSSPLAWEDVPIGQLPLYNEDLEKPGRVPVQWREFRAALSRADAVLFATPEYNRSMPGSLKNALDVGSRPYGESAWGTKPAAIVSVSPGAIGAFGANHHLRQALVFLGMPTMAQPEAYVGGANKLFDESGKITKPETDDFLRAFVDAFAKWAAMNLGAKSADRELAGARS